MGQKADMNELYGTLYRKALEGMLTVVAYFPWLFLRRACDRI